MGAAEVTAPSELTGEAEMFGGEGASAGPESSDASELTSEAELFGEGADTESEDSGFSDPGGKTEPFVEAGSTQGTEDSGPSELPGEAETAPEQSLPVEAPADPAGISETARPEHQEPAADTAEPPTENPANSEDSAEISQEKETAFGGEKVEEAGPRDDTPSAEVSPTHAETAENSNPEEAVSNPVAESDGDQPDRSQSDAAESQKTAEKSEEITPEELTDKTRSEIRELADEKGFIPDGDKSSPDYPRKWIDPAYGTERIRLDRGHVDPDTNKPYDNPNAAVDHVHAYEPDGTRIEVNNDPHIPTKGE